MATISFKLGSAGQAQIITGGDLKNYFASDADAVFELADGQIANLATQPLSSLPHGGSITANMQLNRDGKWSLGSKGNVDFTLGANAKATLTITPSGAQLFTYTKSQEDDDGFMKTTEEPYIVPAGKVYVSIELTVGMEVTGGGAYSSGGFGAKANVDAKFGYTLINDRSFNATETIANALQTAFNGFLLPFKADSLSQLPDQGFLRHDMFGNLDISAEASYGVDGLFFAGIGGGDLAKSLSTPAGTAAATLKPSFKASVAFGIDYQHEDAFHFIYGRAGNSLSVVVLKQNSSTLGVSLDASFGISSGAAVTVQITPDQLTDSLVDKLVKPLEGTPAYDAARQALKDNLKKAENKAGILTYIKEAQDQIASLVKEFKSLTDRQAELKIEYTRIKSFTGLYYYKVDMTQADALSQALPLMSAGHFAQASRVRGVTMEPGTFIEQVSRRRTTISLHFFGLFNSETITEYFNRSQIVYEGQGVFRLLYQVGVTSISRKGITAEVFFTAPVTTPDFSQLHNVDVKLHLVLTEAGQADVGKYLASVLRLLPNGDQLATPAGIVESEVAARPGLTARIAIVLGRSAFSRLDYTRIINGQPVDLAQGSDKKNWSSYVDSIDQIDKLSNKTEEHVPDLVKPFQNWQLYNVVAIDGDGSTKPPNRTRFGSAFSWPSDWASLSLDQAGQVRYGWYFEAGQGFMNLCEALFQLPAQSDAVQSASEYDLLKRSLDKLISQDIRIPFIQATLLALCQLISLPYTNISFPIQGNEIAPNLNISFQVGQ